MTITYSEHLRNVGIDARIAAIGPSPQLRIKDEAGTVLMTMKLPVSWMSKAAGGVAHKRGTWAAMAEKKGKPRSFEIADTTGNAHITGQIPGDMNLGDDEDRGLDIGHSVIIDSFDIAAGNW